MIRPVDRELAQLDAAFRRDFLDPWRQREARDPREGKTVRGKPTEAQINTEKLRQLDVARGQLAPLGDGGFRRMPIFYGGPAAPIDLARFQALARYPVENRCVVARATGTSFGVRAEADTTEINIYDVIGFWGVSAAEIRRKLDEVRTAKLLVRINSPGGDVFDGLAIYNDLAAHPAEVTVRVTGLAASAASLIAMAGKRIEIGANAFLMIHNAWVVGIGDKAELRQLADVLAEIDVALAGTYARRTGKTAKDVAALMDAETWLSGETAIAEKFADAVIGDAEDDAPGARARFDLNTRAFKRVPAAAMARYGMAAPTEDDLELQKSLAALERLTDTMGRAAAASRRLTV